MINDLISRLHPDHLADLRKSGLSDDTIREAGIRSVPPRDINEIFGYETHVKSALNDLSIPLYITEGEKKALKACQEGLYCVAISGLWNWKVKDKDELISDFDLIALGGRTAYIVPDNDWLLPDRYGKSKNLRQAVYGLAYKLINRGSRVSWVELSGGAQ